MVLGTWIFTGLGVPAMIDAQTQPAALECAPERLAEFAFGERECVEDASCPYRCCRRRKHPPSSPCYCSACCVGLKQCLKDRPRLVQDCRKREVRCREAALVLASLVERLADMGRKSEAMRHCRELFTILKKHPELRFEAIGEELVLPEP